MSAISSRDCCRENCWLCKAMFHNRTALVKHLVSPEHRCLTVLCPWCQGKTRTFTKISDLEVHMRSCHPDIMLPRDRFSRSNGFYFSTFPEDYAKIVENVGEYDSDAAYDIRKAVRRWAEGFTDRKERIEKWNNGWKAGVRIAAGRDRKKSSESSERRTVQNDKSDSSKSIGNVSGGGKSVSDIGTRDHGNDKGDARNVCEKRAVGRVETDSPVKRKRSNNERNEKREKQRRVSVEREMDGLDNYVDDIEIGEGKEDDQTKECSKGTGEARKKHERRNYTGSEEAGQGRNEFDNEVRDGEDEVDEDDQLNDEGAGKDTQVRQSIGTANGARTVNDDASRVDETGNRGKRNNNMIDQGQRGMKGNEVENWLEREGHSRSSRIDEERASESGSTTSSSSSSISASPAVSRDLGEGIRARAYRILARGAMPLCPPARRDWTSIKTLEIECNGQEMFWPPSNWRVLTADQKLMAHEYTALFLERRRSADFPQLSRKALLDKYSFLTLEGEGNPHDEESDVDKIDGKIRQYNFTYVKGIVKGDIVGTRMSWTIVKSLERADRWTDTDVITDKLNSGGVNLRL